MNRLGLAIILAFAGGNITICLTPAQPRHAPTPDTPAAICERNVAALQTAVAGGITDSARLMGLMATTDACGQTTPESGR